MDLSADLETLLTAYCAGPNLLGASIAGLDDAGLDQAIDSQNWSIRQYVHHVVDGDLIWQIGLLAALGQAPAFDLAWYWNRPQTEWVDAWQYAARPIQPALEFFNANRQRAAGLLRGIPGALAREMTVTWQSRPAAPLSARDILLMQTRHVTGHIEDIHRIRRARGL